MQRQAKVWLVMAVLAFLFCADGGRADDAPCADGGCSKGRWIDHFPYVWYLRMHWGHREIQEEYGSACYNVTPSYRVFKPNCWYVDAAELYPAGPPPQESKTPAMAAQGPQSPQQLPPPQKDGS